MICLWPASCAASAASTEATFCAQGAVQQASGIVRLTIVLEGDAEKVTYTEAVEHQRPFETFFVASEPI
jgi:hypothetical protein